MGGRGSKSGSAPGPSIGGAGGGLMPNNQSSQNSPNNVANQPATPQNTPVTPGGVTALAQMSDDQLATLINQSKRVQMPNHLSDVYMSRSVDQTQKFVYAAGLNEKPTVLDTADFNKYLSDNNIPRSQLLARSTGGADFTVAGTQMRMTPQQVSLQLKDSSLTYVGGKRGGQVHGAGTYFDQNGGRPTGYSSSNGVTIIAALSKKARVIDESRLMSQSQRWARSHPRAAAAIGPYTRQNQSIYALAQGYNVIQFGSYHNVIERSALVIRRQDY